MKKIISVFIPLFFLACSKDPNIQPKSVEYCGTSNTALPTLKYLYKLKVEGVNNADSIVFEGEQINTALGNPYRKTFLSATLPISDSGLFYSKPFNQLSIIIYNNDTTALFSSSIFINNNLRTLKIAHTNSFNKKTIATIVL